MKTDRVVPISLYNNRRNILDNYDIGIIKRVKKIKRELNLQKIFIIETSKGKYLLKQYEKSKFKTARRGFSLLMFLQKKNYPSVRLILTKNKKQYISCKNQQFTLWEFIKEKENRSISIKEAYELGKALGLLHKITKDFIIYNSDSYNKYNKIFKKNYYLINKAPKRIKIVLSYVKDNFEKLKIPISQPKAVCHEEFSIEHVRFKDNKIIKIIDWDGAGRDFMFYDLGLTLTMAIQKQKINFGILKQIISGYESQRKLTEWEKKHLFEGILFGASKYLIWGMDEKEIKHSGWAWRTIKNIEILMKDKKVFYQKLKENLPSNF